MHQIDFKLLFWSPRSPADTFSYLGSAPMINIGAYMHFRSSAVDDHFWVKTPLFLEKSGVLTLKWRLFTCSFGPRCVSVFGVRQYKSVQKLSTLLALFKNQNFILLQCTIQLQFTA